MSKTHTALFSTLPAGLVIAIAIAMLAACCKPTDLGLKAGDLVVVLCGHDNSEHPLYFDGVVVAVAGNTCSAMVNVTITGQPSLSGWYAEEYVHALSTPKPK